MGEQCDYMRGHGEYMREHCKYIRKHGEYMREHDEYIYRIWCIYGKKLRYEKTG